MAELDTASAIAIVGMAGRFPGAADVDALWERVCRGDDCLADLDPDELIAAGLPPATVRAPDYVTRAGIVDDVAGFDAEFFGIGPRDASLMDPQHRHFLECAWEALESAGCVPERFGGAIGVFAGCGMNTYLLNNLLTDRDLVEQVGWFLLRHTGNDKDFLPTFVSYKLDLRGPSVSVQTACSTSLVAVHLAAQSLLSLECDLALAGGVTIEIPHGVGYTYREGEILAPDGRCRAFDAASAGTVLTSGVGVVALRRLDDALGDGDPILAVLRGSAVNNDGHRKVGYLAPSVDGHADVVKEALAVAGISADDLQLVEAHGTGTAVGDPIEVAALTAAFRASTDACGFCRLVSTKPNIGHLDTAAGVASLIKVVQALRHATLPPLANFTAANPLLTIEKTPFALSAAAAPWPAAAPRRAGVSSLGVGGTNAHVIVEEAAELPATPTAVGEQLLCVSAATAAALDGGTHRLADHLEGDPACNLADVAHTLALGRRAMTHRRAVVAADAAGAADILRGGDRSRHADGIADDDRPPSIALAFPGGGSQYAGMAAGFDARFAAFDAARREGIAAVRESDGPDLAPLLLGAGTTADGAMLQRADVSLPAVFVTCVALARQWMAWGVDPAALLGHSLGEYVAAHLAGVMSFADAVGLVVTRSRLMARASEGGAAMLVVPLDEGAVRAELPPSLSLSVVNADDECVVGGASADVERFGVQLAERDVVARPIALSAAAHSALLDPVLDEFGAAVRSVTLHPPQRRYLSNVTGDWITKSQATDPQYWVDHLRGTVRFADCLRTLLADGPTVLAELGPGQALSSYARRQRPAPVAAIPALRHPDDTTPDSAHTLLAFAKQWIAGADVDLGQFSGSGRRKLRLPTYAFQHQRRWVDPVPGADTRAIASPAVDDGSDRLRRLPAIADWFWEPTWDEQPPPVVGVRAAPRRMLLVADSGDPLAKQLATALRSRGHTVIAEEMLDPEALPSASTVVILDPHGATGDAVRDLETAAARWLGMAVEAVRDLGARAADARLVVVTRGATMVDGPVPRPHHALALGPVLVAPKEYPGLTTALVDVDSQRPPVAAIVNEIEVGAAPVVAYRRRMRFTPNHRHIAVPEPAQGAFREGGTYVVTGGLGDVGAVLAAHLAVRYRANLVIVSSQPLPPEGDRDRWLRAHGSDDATSRRIRRVRELERLGTKVVTVVADVSDRAALRRALDVAERAVGPLTGAIHAAGTLRDRLLALATPDDLQVVLAAKAVGAANLADELRSRGAELLVLASSTSTLLAAPGQAAYVAANAYLDALARQRGQLRVVTISFGAWAGIGMAADAARRARLGLGAAEPIVDHPVFTARHADGAGLALVGQLDSRHDWLVNEHRTAAGTAILPGAGHVELMIDALAIAAAPLALRDVALLRPLPVADHTPAMVRVRVAAPSADGSRRISLEASLTTESGWIRHSEAIAVDAPAVPAPPALDERGAIPFDPLEHPRRDLVLGERWNCIVTASRTANRVVGELALPDRFADEPGWWRAHPALVDAATALAVALEVPAGEQLLVPAGYERVTVWGPVGPEVTAVAELAGDAGKRDLRADVTLVTGGHVVARLEGLRLRAVDPVTFGTTADEVDDARLVAAGAFVELAERLGIRAADGPELVERAVSRGQPRVIASSVDLDELITRSAPGDDSNDGNAAAASGAEIESGATVDGQLAEIWRDLLGVADVDPEANFFDLGGHSLIAIRLMARIQRDFAVQLPISLLFEAPTISALAQLITAERPPRADTVNTAGERGSGHDADDGDSGSRYRPIVAIRSAGSRQPLFVVHGAGGTAMFLHRFARHLDADRPVYGIQAIGTDPRDQPDPSIDAMVDRYLTALNASHSGPFLLGGYSGGGIVTMEMARRLQAAGEKVTAVVLFDSIARGRFTWSRRRVWTNVATQLLLREARGVAPFLRHRLASRLGRLAPPTEATGSGGGETTVDLFEHFTDLAARFELSPVDVDVVLLKSELSWPAHPRDYYWTPYVEGSLRIEYVGGTHTSMFDAVNAPGLGARLEAILADYE